MRGTVALYRPHAGADWCEYEIIGLHRLGGIILREIGPLLPGVMLVNGCDVRVPA